MADQVDVLIIGAGPAGLAVAGCLLAKAMQPTLIEKSADVASSWRAHYDRLHLHTVKELSALPGLAFPKHYPRYVPRDRMVEYLESYAALLGIAPQLSQEATAIRPFGAGRWETSLRSGRRIVSRAVVLATGANAQPNMPSPAGGDTFAGQLTHSRSYRDAAPFAGQQVLVVGMGNTGAEIALDLAEHGVSTTLSVRSPVSIVYRDVLGRPTQRTSIALSRLPEAWGDAIAHVFRDFTVGDLSRYGLATSPVSPLRELRRHGRTPVIDIGTVARIKAGQILVRPGLRELTRDGAEFTDGTRGRFDAIIMATGYRAGLGELFPEGTPPLDDRGLPLQVAGQGALAGVYFVGFDIRQPGGLLRAIGLQARQVAQLLAREENRGA